MDTNDAIETGTLACASGGSLYYARPPGAGPFPCLVIIHERYGLVQHTKDIADRFARNGYVGIAPDLFYRHPDIAAVNRGDGRCDVSDPQSVEDLESALMAVKDGIRGADMERLAVMGVCQSGRYPLVLAAHRPIGAALVFYGAASDREWKTNKLFPVPLEDLMARIDCPVLGVFGEGDHVVHIDGVRKFRNILEDHKKSYRIHIFRGAPHGWLNDTMPGRYRPDASERAWQLAFDFLNERLGSDEHHRTVSWEFLSESAPDYDFSKNERLE